MKIDGIEIEEIGNIKVLIVEPGQKVTISRGEGYLILHAISGHGIVKEGKHPDSGGCILRYDSVQYFDFRSGNEFIIENNIHEGNEPKQLRIIILEMKRVKK